MSFPMHFIDDFAYNNRLRKIDPAFKAGLVGVILAVCILAGVPHVGLASTLVITLLAVGPAAIPLKVFGRVLLAEFAFFLLATVGVAVSITITSPLSINPWAIQIGPLWFSSSPAMLENALLIITRVMGCASAMNFLALTTPMVEVIGLLRRLRVPELILDLMTLMYRYIFVLLESLDRMVLAQEVRMGFNGWRRSFNSAGQIGANLFIEAFRRSKKLEIALQGRGWDGSLRVLPQEYEPLFRTHSQKKEDSHVD
jgi:cobalt/nickel transport system permease protein